MVPDEVRKYIQDSRKAGAGDEETTQNLVSLGWDNKTIQNAFYLIADQYEKSKKTKLWLIRIFYGRINRIEFLVGSLLFYILGLIFVFILTVINGGSSLVPIKLSLPVLILIFFYYSLIIRRINDTGFVRNSFLVFLYVFGSLTLFLYLMKGSQNVNEDGYPPKPFNGSLRNLFSLN